MATSRSQLGRVLDTSNVSFQFDTLIKAVSALSKEIKIKIKRATKRRRHERRPRQGVVEFATDVTAKKLHSNYTQYPRCQCFWFGPTSSSRRDRNSLRIGEVFDLL
jgi:hypothetical protein